VGYLCANFSLPRPLCSRLRPDVRDRLTDRRQTDVRQTDVRHQTASSLYAPAYYRLLGPGHNNAKVLFDHYSVCTAAGLANCQIPF